MAQAFIPQGTFITCTNATSTAPQKIGHSRSTMLTIHTRLPEPLLNIDDRKLSGCFVCKMPQKKWGGLMALCAGIVIGGAAIALCVATLGAAAPVLLVALATLSKAAVVVAVVAVGSAGIAAYKTAHDCDQTLEKDDAWEKWHKTVFIEDKPALLNRSYMKCPTGGKLDLILDEGNAYKAAGLIAGHNRKEVNLQLGSQFLGGLVAGGTGGANLPGIALTVGFYIWDEDSESNKRPDIVGDVVKEVRNALAEPVIGTGVKAVASAKGYQILGGLITMNNGGLLPTQALETVFKFLVKTEGTLKTGQAIRQQLGRKLTTSSAKVGYGGAMAGFIIDQGSNMLEREQERQVENEMLILNNKDEDMTGQGQKGGVYAVDV